MRGPLLAVVKPVIHTCIKHMHVRGQCKCVVVCGGIFRQNYLDNLGERVHFCFTFHFYLVSKEVSNEF